RLRLERAMSEQAVEAHGHAHGREQIESAEERQVGYIHPPVPDQDDGDQEAGKRDHDAGEVGRSLDPRHGPQAIRAHLQFPLNEPELTARYAAGSLKASLSLAVRRSRVVLRGGAPGRGESSSWQPRR